LAIGLITTTNFIWVFATTVSTHQRAVYMLWQGRAPLLFPRAVGIPAIITVDTKTIIICERDLVRGQALKVLRLQAITPTRAILQHKTGVTVTVHGNRGHLTIGMVNGISVKHVLRCHDPFDSCLIKSQNRPFIQVPQDNVIKGFARALPFVDAIDHGTGLFPVLRRRTETQTFLTESTVYVIT
jgi:hypothetical protein